MRTENFEEKHDTDFVLEEKEVEIDRFLSKYPAKREELENKIKHAENRICAYLEHLADEEVRKVKGKQQLTKNELTSAIYGLKVEIQKMDSMKPRIREEKEKLEAKVVLIKKDLEVYEDIGRLKEAEVTLVDELKRRKERKKQEYKIQEMELAKLEQRVKDTEKQLKKSRFYSQLIDLEKKIKRVEMNNHKMENNIKEQSRKQDYEELKKECFILVSKLNHLNKQL
eukprot:snap_masked-scaffold_35-processed-gene-2.21-mRNA-1 protein AED:0.94 eAED:1.00 QI:0/-1/0/1/-1/1/1/0/225